MTPVRFCWIRNGKNSAKTTLEVSSTARQHQSFCSPSAVRQEYSRHRQRQMAKASNVARMLFDPARDLQKAG
jgi:hypothetical protein